VADYQHISRFIGSSGWIEQRLTSHQLTVELAEDLYGDPATDLKVPTIRT
jgi:hypothetical protein